jgi:hypothetical protein
VLLGDNAPTHTVGDAEVDEEHSFKVINLSNVKLINSTKSSIVWCVCKG